MLALLALLVLAALAFAIGVLVGSAFVLVRVLPTPVALAVLGTSGIAGIIGGGLVIARFIIPMLREWVYEFLSSDQ